jgi:hypothetical protein
MSETERSRVSRRSVLGSTLAVPLIGAAPASAGFVGMPGGGSTDPVLGLAGAWIANREQLEALIFEWQRLEKALMKKAKALGVDMDDARGGGSPEAAGMRTVDRTMDTTYGVLECLAREASGLRAVSAEGALAKVDLGLRVQGRYGWQPYALELLQGGVGELGACLAR